MRPLIKLPVSLFAFAVALCGGRKGIIASGANTTLSKAHAVPSHGLGKRTDGKVWSNNLAAKLSATVADLGADDRARHVTGVSACNERNST